MGTEMLFQDWSDLGRTLIVGVLAYIALVALLRASGKRTLSKMNAFDLVVTVALGSTLATILLSEDVALAEGIVAFVVLIGLQFAITWSSYRSERVSDLVKSTPSLLFYEGTYLDSAMRRERIVRSEVNAAIRAQGFASVSSVLAVVLETDGSVTIVERNGSEMASAMDGVRGLSSVSDR